LRILKLVKIQFQYLKTGQIFKKQLFYTPANCPGRPETGWPRHFLNKRAFFE